MVSHLFLGVESVIERWLYWIYVDQGGRKLEGL
jgi:hypothetical protein